jgi:DNA replication licensing factor MCM2
MDLSPAPDQGEPKRRRIIIDDDDDEVGSNPDMLINDDEIEEEEGEGEDLMETWKSDYVPAPELDNYESEHLATEDIRETYLENLRNRQIADEEIEARDERMRQARLQGDRTENRLEGLDDRDREDLDSDDEDFSDDDEDIPGAEGRLNLDAFDCPLQEWISESRTRREIQNRFRRFLQTYYLGIERVSAWERQHKDEENPPKCPFKKYRPIYPSKIRAMCAENSASLEVDYGHLGEMQSLLAIWLTDVPRDMLQIFDEVLKDVVLKDFPHYAQIAKELHVRIVELPISDRLRDLRQNDLNNLIRVSGVVTRRTDIYPQIKANAYDCTNCSQQYGPYPDDKSKPIQCPACHTGILRFNSQRSEYRNYQKITLQETPGSVPPGRVPRHKEVELLGDLIDIARPGEEIDVIGIYAHTQNAPTKAGFPVYGTHIKANCIQKKSGSTNSGLSEEDKRVMRELSLDPQIGQRIIRSIAPSIYGHIHVKTAVALSLFGGCAKQGGNGTHRVRGDINVLLLGDPGTAKSQILKYAEKTAPRAVFTTGKGASAVGLTAGVHRDPITKEWTLEGGALVLADQGVCLIDEFDKMNEQDRTSIHEAMEQQTISVSKAGIVTSLQARCAVLAAANPIGGRYDASFNLTENVELTDPILQRFDILCVLQDTVDPVADEQLANFVVSSHMRSHPDFSDDDEDEDVNDNDNDENSNSDMNNLSSGLRGGRQDEPEDDDYGPPPLDQDTLKKYILYARSYVKPILHHVDSEKIAALYADLRKQSALSGGVPIAVRHIESVMRMSEASAKMHLREHVRQDDVDKAIKVMLESFLQAQKAAVRTQLQRSFRKYINFGEDTSLLLMHQLRSLVAEAEKLKACLNKERGKETIVPMERLEKRAKDINIYDLREFYVSKVFSKHNFSIDERNKLIIKSYY